jgi:hypothetical protein
MLEERILSRENDTDKHREARRMQILIARGQKTALSTPSLVSVNGVRLFFGLEPVSPIAAGVYPVTVSYSPKLTAAAPAALRASWRTAYGSELVCTPHLNNVPGHTEVEIHFGNYPRDTEDCLLVGLTRAPDFVGQSDEAFLQLMAMLRKIATIHVNPLPPTPGAAPALIVPHWDLSEEATAVYEDFKPAVVTDSQMGL